MSYHQTQASEVKKLIDLYRARPDLFESAEIEQLNNKAQEVGMNFKPLEEHVNLKNIARQFSGGFLEGFTTIPITERPRTTYESISRSLGHLAGFAPAILTAPLKGVGYLAGKVGLKGVKEGIATKAIPRMTKFGEWSLPMIGSRYAKRGVDKVIDKAKLDAFSTFKTGGVGRAITEEAVGLGTASVVSNVWQGTDQYLDSFVGGAVAGGAFGGIGNFVRLGNVFKGGSKESVQKAESALKAGIGASVMGLPSTLRDEPIEMQLYEYLLGGFFGYNSRPAFEQAGGKFVNDLNFSDNRGEFFTPSKSARWNDLSSRSKEYVHKKSTEQSKSYINRIYPEIDLEQRAYERVSVDNKKPKQSDIDKEIRTIAYEIYNANRVAWQAETVRSSAKAPETQEDFMDGYETATFTTMGKAKDAFINQKIKEFDSVIEIGKDIDATIEASIKNDKPNVETFINSIKNKSYTLGSESEARRFYHQKSQTLKEVEVIDARGEDSVVISKENGKVTDNKTLGQKRINLPLNELSDSNYFNVLTHIVKQVKNEDGSFRDTYEGLFKTKGDFESFDGLKYNVSSKDLYNTNKALNNQSRYLFSGVKDKDYAVTADYVDFVIKEGQKVPVNMEQIYNNLSPEQSKKLKDVFNTSLKNEYKLLNDILEEGVTRITPEKEAFIKSIHEKKFVSNILHDAHINGLYNHFSGDFTNINRIFNNGYGKNVIDFNKRMQGYLDSGVPQVKESYPKSAPDGKINVMIAQDVHKWNIPEAIKKEFKSMESDTDGATIIEQTFFQEGIKANGLPIESGAYKPVIMGKTKLGNIFNKSNGQRAEGEMQQFMKDNNIQMLLFDSSAKLRGENKTTEIFYEGGEIVAKEPNYIQLDIESLRINPSTFENPKKFSGDINISLQFGNVLNTLQTKKGTDLFYKEFIEPSLNGTEEAIKLTSNPKDLIEKLKSNPEFVDSLPMKFILESLNERNTVTARAIRKAIQKIRPENSDVELETDSTFADYHDANKVLFNLADGMYMPNAVLKPLRKPYENMLRKYIIKRYRNPKYKTAGKSWLKGFTPDMLGYADMAPTTKGTRRTINEGEILLDNYHKKTPAIYDGKQTTLGAIWKSYIKALNKGLDTSKHTEALTVLGIRTPADSISGIRELKIVGFTNQRGAGAITHHKDNVYLGGADKDSDYISWFQGVNKDLRKVYKKESQDREHLYKNDNKLLNKLKEEFGTDSKGIESELESRWSPSMRVSVHKGARKGLQGLGNGLSAKEYLMEIAHQIEKFHGGTYTETATTSSKNAPYEMTVKVRSKKERRKFFDNAYMIVNASADASKYKNIKPYSQFRDLLFDSLFEVTDATMYGKRINQEGTVWAETFGYNNFMSSKANNGNGTKFSAIPDLIKNLKSKSYGESENKLYELADTLYKYSRKTLEDGTPNVNYIEGGNIAVKTAEKMYKDGVHKLLTNDLPDVNIIVKEAVKNYTKDKSEIDFLTKHVSKELRGLLNFQNAGKGVGSANKRNQGLDNTGKNIANITAYELINEKALTIYKDFLTAKKSNPEILANELQKISKKALEISRELNNKAHQNGKDVVEELSNSRYTDLDTAIMDYVQNNLAEFARNNKVPLKSLKEYFELWMLTPYRGQNARYKYDFDKPVWGSDYITPTTKKSFFTRMEDIYTRASSTAKQSREVLDLKGAELEYFEKALKNFDVKSLDSNIKWNQVEFASGAKQPRLTSYYGDKGTDYTYSGVYNKPLEWTPELLKLKAEVEKATGYTFNSALLNKYRTGKDKIGFHKDSEPELGTDPIIASVSFGSERNFKLKSEYKESKVPFSIKLKDGSLLLMGKGTQKNYFHGIDAEANKGERINVTFRNTNTNRVQERNSLRQFEVKNFSEFTSLDTNMTKTVKTSAKIKDKLKPSFKKLGITDNDVKELDRLEANLKERDYLGQDFNQFFMDFTNIMEGGVARTVETMNMNDVYAMNRYVEDVFKTVKDRTYLPVSLRHWLQDPRTIAREMESYERIYREQYSVNLNGEAKKLHTGMSSFGSMREFMRKMLTQQNSHIDKIREESLKDFDFKKDLNIKDQQTLMDIVIARRNLKTNLDVEGKKTEEEILNSNDSQLFLNKNIRIKGINRKGSHWAEVYDKKFSNFFETFGNQWLWTKDSKGNKFNWKEFDNNPKYGIINKYIKYNKDGKFDFKNFLKKTIKPIDANTPAPVIGLEQLLRFQYEYVLEAKLKKETPANKKAWREAYRKGKNKFKDIGQINTENYFPRMNHGYNLKSQRSRDASIDMIAKARFTEAIQSGKSPKEAQVIYEKYKGRFNNFIDSSLANSTHLEKPFLDYILEDVGFNNRPNVALERGNDYIGGFDRRPIVLNTYKERFIRSYFKALASIQGNNRIDSMMEKMPFDANISDKRISELKKAGYSSQSEVWGDYLKLYLRDSLGHPSRFTHKMINSMEKGDPLALKKNPYFLTSDHYLSKKLEGLYTRLNNKKMEKFLPYFNNAPEGNSKKAVEAREEYFIRRLHDLGHLEAKYELLTLLANSGSLVANIYGGAQMTISNAGLRNFVKSKSDKIVTSRLLKNEDGSWAINNEKGQPIKNRKELQTYLVEKGIIDSYIANELEYNPKLAQSLNRAGENGKNFLKELKKAFKKGKVRDETISQLAERYGVTDVMLKYGGFFMQSSERINRVDAFISHALQAQDRFSTRGNFTSLKDPAIFEAGMKGIETTQFLYHSAFRPAFMRTSMGKVLTRFKLFAFQSVRTRKEFYKQAKYYNFKEGTPAYDKFKDMFILDTFGFALASAFAYSLFDTTLPPPFDWLQESSELLFGDKRERDRAFYGTYPRAIAPLQILTPPIARVPQAIGQLINGEWDRFADYTVHTLYPFGRLYKQLDKTAENPHRVLENFMRLPANKLIYRHRRQQVEKDRKENIERLLG